MEWNARVFRGPWHDIDNLSIHQSKALAAAFWIALILAGAGIRTLKKIRTMPEPLALGFLAGLCALGIHCLISVPQYANSLLAVVYIAAVMAHF